jgi:hypothetical protein
MAEGDALLRRLNRTPLYARTEAKGFDTPAHPTGPSPDEGSYLFNGELDEAIGQLLAMVKTLDARLAALEAMNERKDAA